MKIEKNPTYMFDISRKVLTNLSSVSDEHYVDEVLKIIENTSSETHKDLYEFARDFFKKHGKYPDKLVLQSKDPDFSPLADDWSNDFLLAFTQGLRREHVQNKASDLLNEGKMAEAEALLATLSYRQGTSNFGIDDVVEAYDKLSTQPGGILTGIREIDDVIKGLAFSTMNVIAAPPSQFKTTALHSIFYNGAFKGGYNLAHITFEVPKRDCWFNYMARHSLAMGNKISAEHLKKGLVPEEQKEFLSQVVADWKMNCKGRIEILDASDFDSFSFSGLAQKFHQLDNQMTNPDGSGGLHAVGIDYIQLLKFGHGEDMVNAIVRYLANMALTFKGRGLILLILSTINRVGAAKLAKLKKASLAMLAEYNELERSGYTVTVMYSSESMRLTNTLLAQVIKNRSGPVQDDMVSVYVDPTGYLVGTEVFDNLFGKEALDIIGDSTDDDLF